jgi:multiple sugar transport system substrate-binding protein
MEEFSMSNRLRSLALGLVGATAVALPAYAVDLEVTCRCVIGGVNSATAEWLQDSVIPAFEAANPGVTVSLNQFGGEDAQLTQQLALDFSTGAGPDVSAFDGFLIPSFVEGGLLRSLDEVAGESVNDWTGWDALSEGSRALMLYDGKFYGIPLGTDVRMLYTRKDILAEAGIDADTWQPTSWDDILEAARAIKEVRPDSFPIQLNAGVAMGEATTMQGYWLALLGTGEAVTDDQGRYIVSSQGILDTLNLYKTIYVDEQLGDQRAQLLADGRNRSFANFRDGVTALLFEGDYFYRSVTPEGSEFAVENRDEVLGWVQVPAQEPGAGIRGQDFVTISGGTGFVLNPATDSPAEAWAFLSFMNEPAQLDAFQALQPRITARTDVEIPDSPFLTEVSQALLPLTTARPNDPDYNSVSMEIQRMTEAVVSGELSPEEAMAQYRSAVIALVGEENTVSLL